VWAPTHRTFRLGYLVSPQIERLNQTPMDSKTFSRAIKFRSGVDVLIDILGPP
jgi:hypothetical protein